MGKKRIVSVFLCVVFLIICWPYSSVSVFAETKKYGNLIYEIKDGEITITDCEESATGEIVIPSKIDEYPVTAIGGSAFYNCKQVTSFVLSDGITSIGSSAFDGTGYYNNEKNWEKDVLYVGRYLVEARQSVSGEYIIKNDTLVIADWAFSNCEELKTVVIPYGVTVIGNYSFVWCSNLIRSVIPDSVTRIGREAFACCEKLKEVYISSNVTDIGVGAFAGCSSLKSAIIPYGITNISGSLFSSCYELEEVSIPRTVTSINVKAFFGCQSLQIVNFEGSEAEWEKIVIAEGNTFLYDAQKHYEKDDNIPFFATSIGKITIFVGLIAIMTIVLLCDPFGRKKKRE